MDTKKMNPFILGDPARERNAVADEAMLRADS